MGRSSLNFMSVEHAYLGHTYLGNKFIEFGIIRVLDSSLTTMLLGFGT